jgi:pimeloyl-ACP methyl ester carboxylesterase
MELYTQEFGPDNAPTIVLLHEAGFASWMWNSQIACLSDDYHLLVPDLPEHGQSADIRPFTISDAASRIAHLIRDRSHGGRATVVGMAVGGQVTIELLSQAPDIIERALVSGVTVRPMPHMWLANLAMWLYWPFKNSRRMIQWNLQANDIPDKYLAEFTVDTLSLTHDQYQRINAVSSAFRIPANLDRVDVPTLVLLAAFERNLKLDSAHDLISIMPNAEAYMVADAKPFWNLQLPDLFNQSLRAWITDRELPAPLTPLA